MASKKADTGLAIVVAMLTCVGCANKKSSDSSDTRPAGFVANIEKLTVQNDDFRHVLFTAKHAQLVVMSIPAGDHIGVETHKNVDQFFRVEEGLGEVMMGTRREPLGPGSAIVVPAGTRHDIRNTGSQPLKLYSLYSPPNHRDGVVHHTREQAEHDSEHFDGVTTPPLR